MAAKVDPKAQLKAFQKFVADKRVMIADPNATSRAAIASILSTMGIKATQLSLVGSFPEAEETIEKIHPSLLICEYAFGKRCGLDLLQNQRTNNPKLKESVFVLVTSNTSQSAVAKAAEEDVDTYIIKPYTPEVLKTSIIRAVLLKIDPPEYVKVIDRGKQEFLDGKVDDALRTFEFAKTLDTAPALGCYYVGQVKDKKQEVDQAETSYHEGLDYNKIHYKCMVGLYENMMSKKKFSEAYAIIQRISRYFPANPQRLTSVLRLAVMTKSYEDIERYYQIFTNVDVRNEEMIRYICAALVVTGKYYLQQNFGSRALELFQKAAVTASGRTKILREIVLALLDAGMAKQADEFLKRFPPDTHKGPDYLAMNLLIMDQMTPRSLVIEKGRELIAKNVHDPVIYRVLIKRSTEAGLKAAVDDLMQEAIKRFPDEKDSFEKALAAGTATAAGTADAKAPGTPAPAAATAPASESKTS